MKLSDRGLALICEFEGYHKALPDGGCAAYLDPVGVPTIGWGCTEGVTLGMVWTREQAQEALRTELAKHEAAVDRLVTVEMTQGQYDALVSFSYNLGWGNLGKSTLLKKLNKGDVDGAAREFGKWNKAGGKVFKGLTRRRAAEMALFLSETIEDGMPQKPEKAADPPPPAVDATAKIGTGAIATQIPVPPDLSPYTAWQSFAETLVGLGTWAMAGPWKLALVGGVVGFLGWGLPWLSRRVQQ